LPAGRLFLAGIIAVILLTPFLWPYYQVSRDQGLVRRVGDVAQYNATWRDYLATGGRLHYLWWSQRFYEGRTALFPGLVALGLAAAAVVSRRMIRDARVRMTIAIGAVGSRSHSARRSPAMRFFTNTCRFERAQECRPVGLAAARLHRDPCRVWRQPPRKARLALRADCPRPARHRRSHPRASRLHAGLRDPAPVRSICRRIGRRRRGVSVLFGSERQPERAYVYANTRYFKPLLNGYSSFHPDTFEARGRALNSFPSEAALAELKVAHVSHVLVHTRDFARRYGPVALDAIDTIPELQFETEEDGIRLYRLK
jgi:hypothetical protein